MDDNELIPDAIPIEHKRMFPFVGVDHCTCSLLGETIVSFIARILYNNNSGDVEPSSVDERGYK
jgi:hypothetical protein